MTNWYRDMLLLYRLKYQSHTYGDSTYKIIQFYPMVIEVRTTHQVSGFTENPFFSPYPFPQQDKLQSSLLATHLIYQFTLIDGDWMMNYKNEDFSKMHTSSVSTTVVTWLRIVVMVLAPRF